MVAGLSPDVEEAVRARYAEPHRRYHDRRHLEYVLFTVDALAGYAVDIDAVRLAALFHDAIYVVGRDDNEVASAQLAQRVLEDAGAPPAVTSEVQRLVLLTRTHDPGPTDDNGAVLSDADLCILAAEPADYARYASDVRAEWAALDDQTFARGRLAVMQGFLLRPQIFRTTHGLNQWEARARDNVGVEVELLRASLTR